MNSEQLEILVKGSIVGQLIGDALGYPFSDAESFPSKLEMITGLGTEHPGEYTSIGAFSLATMSSLLNEESQDDMMNGFYEVYIGGQFTSDGNCYDVSPTTAQSINNFSNGIPVDLSDTTGDNDNDCLHRMLPVALFYCCEPTDVIISQSHNICKLTHNNINSQVTCALVSLIIRNLLLQNSEKAFDVLLHYYQENEMQPYYEAAMSLKTWKSTNTCSGAGNPADCFWSAWTSFGKFEADYELCVKAAIHYGHDTNSTAALAGALSALSNGLNDIPSKWLKTIRLSSEVMDLVLKFTNNVVNKIIRREAC